MSIFDDIPSEFPFDVELTERPVSFRLAVSVWDHCVRGFLSLVRIAMGPLLIYALFEPFMTIGVDVDPVTVVCWLVIAAYLVWAVCFYFGPEILRLFRGVEVRITDDDVHVTCRILFLPSTWSRPLKDYQGVALKKMGTVEVDGKPQQVAVALLKHREEHRSVPLTFRLTNHIGHSTVARKAEQLGVPMLDETLQADEYTVYPPDIIVANTYQSFKVRAICWIASALGILLISLILTKDTSPGAMMVSVGILAVWLLLQFYAARYVVGMREDDDHIEISTATLLWNHHRFPKTSFRAVKEKRGKLQTYRLHVDAPYITLSVAG